VRGLVTLAQPGWEDEARKLVPGAHVVLLTDYPHKAIEGRLLGLELRDTLLVLRPGPISGFVFLFRVPIAESTVAAQALATGTGGINVDGCRVKHANAADLESHKAMVAAIKAKGGSMANSWKNSSDLAGANDVKEGGRWPPNVLLVHAGCRRTGEARIEGHKGYPNGPGGSSSQFSQKGTPTTRTGSWEGHADADGKETITTWECELGCPVSLLDEMSGNLTTNPGTVTKKMASMGYHGGSGSERQVQGDTGGASRFYPQFEDEHELLAWLTKLITRDA